VRTHQPRRDGCEILSAVPIRDWTSLVYPTQHCVLGYSQASLRD
jgi:hypothetical protein